MKSSRVAHVGVPPGARLHTDKVQRAQYLKERQTPGQSLDRLRDQSLGGARAGAHVHCAVFKLVRATERLAPQKPQQPLTKQ